MIIEFTLIVKHEELVDCNFDHKNDSFYLTGSLTEIGNWDIYKAVSLKLANNKWSAAVEISDESLLNNFSYKYFLAKKCNSSENSLFFKKTEIHSRLYKNSDDGKVNDLWCKDLYSQVDGWLLQKQFEVQFNFFKSPLNIFSNVEINQENSIQIITYEDVLSSFIVINEKILTVKLAIISFFLRNIIQMAK